MRVLCPHAHSVSYSTEIELHLSPAVTEGGRTAIGWKPAAGWSPKGRDDRDLRDPVSRVPWGGCRHRCAPLADGVLVEVDSSPAGVMTVAMDIHVDSTAHTTHGPAKYGVARTAVRVEVE